MAKEDTEDEEFFYQQPSKRWQEGYVYLLDYGDKNTFKIGQTKHEPDLRFKQISGGHNVLMPMHLVITAHTYTNCWYLEQVLHMLFDHRHIKGEWFDLHDIDDLLMIFDVLRVFSNGNLVLHSRWFELMPKDYKEMMNHGAIEPHRDMIFNKEDYDFLTDMNFDDDLFNKLTREDYGTKKIH